MREVFAKLFKRKKPEYDKFQEEHESAQSIQYDLYSPELVEWIAVTNDPILLSCAYYLINSWEWPYYLPKPKPEFGVNLYGFIKFRDYKSYVFCTEIMRLLKDKTEALSPGVSKLIRMTRYYRKYSRKNENPIEDWTLQTR